jgi:hypothetical protein
VHALHANCGRHPRTHRLSKRHWVRTGVQVLMHIMFAMQLRRSMPVMLLNANCTLVETTYICMYLHQDT